MDIRQILKEVKNHNAPDVHIMVGQPPVVRLPNGEVYVSPDVQVLTREDVEGVIQEVTPADKLEVFREKFEVDFSFTLEGEGGDSGARFRVNLYMEKNGPALAFRLIPYEIPDALKFGVPEVVMNLAGLPRGLVLITGPTGSGKSTTLTMIIDKINRERKAHIITIEDPIEFIHKSGQSIVTQRELGSHTKSFPSAIKASLRQDPDVVMIGEMRDLDTIMAALTLAETGHLVFSTLHTQDAPQTINRIVDAFPEFQQQQIQTQLSLVLKGVVAQTLIPRKDAEGRVCAYEIMLANEGVQSCIKDGKTHQLYSMMQIGKKEGMRTLDDDLLRLVNEGIVEPEVALSKARDLDDMKGKLGI
ncbi:PilT/PilU family type 4a pilus ATPase [Candidatus Peregrinibacteria bacterium]|jgi:twitching motility protein PilT|nr:PilT/PilU family type 4a pilus ATPase [Candidatus Peregrinibacteria bacterium]